MGDTTDLMSSPCTLNANLISFCCVKLTFKELLVCSKEVRKALFYFRG
jgi:hypothetical protein